MISSNLDIGLCDFWNFISGAPIKKSEFHSERAIVLNGWCFSWFYDMIQFSYFVSFVSFVCCFRFLFYFCFVWQDIVPRLSFHLLQIDFARFFIFRKSHRRCSVKEVFLKISQNAHENTFAWATFKYSCRPIKKETLTQVFSSEFCETFKATFF